MKTRHRERDEFEMDQALDHGRMASQRPGYPVDPTRLLRRLYKARYLLVLSLVIGGGLGILLSRFAFPPSYLSSVTVRFDGMPALPGLSPPTPVAVSAYADGVFAEPVLRRVQRELGDEVPATLHGMTAAITRTSDPQSGAIRAEVRARSPESARNFAAALGESFIEYQLEQQRARLNEAHRRLGEQLELAREGHRRARAAWDQFRERHGIDSIESEQGRLASAAELRTQAILAQNEVNALEERVTRLKREIARTPKLSVSQHSRTSPEAIRLAEAEAELALKEATLTPAHPEIAALKRQVQTLRLRIANGLDEPVTTQLYGPNSERSTLALALAEAESALALQKGRAEGLRKHADEATERVAAFSAIEGQAVVMLSNLEVQRDLESRLDAERARIAAAILKPEAGFTVVKPAHLPESAEGSKMATILRLVSPFLAFALVALVLLFLEVRDLKIRTANELAFWTGAPVIASSTWPGEPGGLEELIESLDDYLPYARGKFLLVGASPWDASLAEAIAHKIESSYLLPAQDPSTSSIEKHAEEETALAKPIRSPMRVSSWGGATEGPSIRRASRLADRVIVIVSSGTTTIFEAMHIRRRIGRDVGVGFILVNVPLGDVVLGDRVGELAEFFCVR